MDEVGAFCVTGSGGVNLNRHLSVRAPPADIRQTARIGAQ
jgi:hypothetical protein